ncbi:MAG TPA: PqqD family protein [Vicinamibacterales bacterium]
MERATPSATPIRPNPDVIARHLGESVVLVHLPSNQVFELNHTGARVWDLLAEGMPFEKIVQTLVDEFDIDVAGVTVDVTDLIDWLRSEGLIQP